LSPVYSLKSGAPLARALAVLALRRVERKAPKTRLPGAHAQVSQSDCHSWFNKLLLVKLLHLRGLMMVRNVNLRGSFLEVKPLLKNPSDGAPNPSDRQFANRQLIQ
jgi:hypothetical protein